MNQNIQSKIRKEYRKAGQISNILLAEGMSVEKGQELRQVKDNCFKKIDFYKNLNKAMNKKKVGV